MHSNPVDGRVQGTLTDLLQTHLGLASTFLRIAESATDPRQIELLEKAREALARVRRFVMQIEDPAARMEILVRAERLDTEISLAG